MAWEKPFTPKGYREWPAQQIDLAPDDIVRLYESGLAGAIYDPAARERMLASVAQPDGEKIAYDNGFAGSGEDALCLPYLYAHAHWPKMWPCPGQTTGDCVSHGGKNAAIVLIGVESALGKPDEKTGKIEGFPEVSAEAELQGVIASEPQYGARGHGGQGASCGTLQRWMMSEGGIYLRQNYPELGIDLTRYNASIGIRWGGRGVPADVAAVGAQHQFRQATDCPTHELVRDFVANGYPNWACSGLGWSSQRDEFGYSRQQGGWSHSWNIIATDYRKKTIAKRGFPLALYIHDWGRWNTGGRDIFESAEYVPAGLREHWINIGLVNAATGNILIPEGSMWIDARLLNRCDNTAMASVNGWPARKLPPFVSPLG